MEEHPEWCCCADCMPDFPLTCNEVEEQRQQELAEQVEGAGLGLPSN
jgi:hypothetical protein